MNTKKTILVLLTAIFLLAVSACGSTAANVEPTATQEAVDITSVAQTAQAQVFGTLTQLAALATATNTPTLSFTGTALPSITPSGPSISVSKETNCRTGPDIVYDRVGGLLPGVVTQVFALDPTRSYYYIENPNYSGSFCWVIGLYATEYGDFSGLPIYLPGPTPTPGTPTVTFTPTATGPTPTGPTPTGPTPTGSSSSGYLCSQKSQTPADGTTFTPSQPYQDLVWVITNDGTNAWAASEVSLKFSSGTNLHGTTTTVLVPATAVGATAQILLDLVIPATAGDYTEAWNVVKGTTTMCTLDLKIKVAP